MLPPHLRCYLINLERSPQRLDAMHARLSALGIDYERIVGVDGLALDETQFREYTRENTYYKPLRRGEVGCWLSQRKALQRFLETDAHYALVLEDDIELDPEICRILGAALALRESTRDARLHWDLLKLTQLRRRCRYIELAALGKWSLVEYGLSVPSATTAGVWTRAGAERWLHGFRGCTRPVDCDLQHPWDYGLSILSIHPPPVGIAAENDRSTMGSPILRTRTPWPKLRYELRRLWPRLRHFARRYGWSVLLTWLWRRHLVYRGANQ